MAEQVFTFLGGALCGAAVAVGCYVRAIGRPKPANIAPAPAPPLPPRAMVALPPDIEDRQLPDVLPFPAPRPLRLYRPDE